MQAPASFNLEAVKAKVEEMIKNREVSEKLCIRRRSLLHGDTGFNGGGHRKVLAAARFPGLPMMGECPLLALSGHRFALQMSAYDPKRT